MIKQVTVVRRDLKMRKGKFAAQCGHAAESFITNSIAQKLKTPQATSNVFEIILTKEQQEWIATGRTKIVVGVNSEEELLALINKAKEKGVTVNPIIDLGKTEFHGQQTLTCASFGPNDNELLDSITGHLELL